MTKQASTRGDSRTVEAAEVLASTPAGTTANRAGNGLPRPRWYRHAVVLAVAAAVIGTAGLLLLRFQEVGSGPDGGALEPDLVRVPLVLGLAFVAWALRDGIGRFWPTPAQTEALLRTTEQALARGEDPGAVRQTVLREADAPVERLAASIDALHGRQTSLPGAQRMPIWAVALVIVVVLGIPLVR